MPILQATCSHCDAALDLTPEDVLLAVDRDATAHYSFQCPHCHHITIRPAGQQLLDALLACGVTVTAAAAGEAGHPESPPDGPPLTVDDLLDLHEVLERPDWFERLLASCRVAGNTEEGRR